MGVPMTFPHRLPKSVLLFSLALALTAQQGPPERPRPPETEEELRLPEWQTSARGNSQGGLSKEPGRRSARFPNWPTKLKADMEKSDYNVLSFGNLQTDRRHRPGLPSAFTTG